MANTEQQMRDQIAAVLAAVEQLITDIDSWNDNANLGPPFDREDLVIQRSHLRKALAAWDRCDFVTAQKWLDASFDSVRKNAAENSE